ncbi:MAG: AAA family ATPase [Candidatus Pacebacteria bacterium]|nr:AAA family ATPase [Candidatus Paceibacterota bacterium]
MQPLADQIRPSNLDEFVGQTHLVGASKPLRQAIEQKHLFSFLLWGPPGVGKTTLARIYAQALEADYHELSAVSAGKADIRQIVTENKQVGPNLQPGLFPKVLFLDEIHRFNKAQQDYLLPFVESGQLTLIGATTENPSFEVISALLSRLRVFVLEALTELQIKQIIKRAQPQLADTAQDWVVKMAGGDARQAINVIEAAQQLYGQVTLKTLKEALQNKFLRYDKQGEEHYNTISAFIKSMRASNVDAALYYLARMVEAGEDPKFIARRMVIFASEDIGLAQPTALVVANAVFDAVQNIGYPEAQINLAHGTAYLAQAKKDRSAHDAYFATLNDVKKHGNLPIPLHLRNAPTKLMKKLGYGKGYKMYPDSKESLLPEKLKGKKYLKKTSSRCNPD